MKQAKIQQEFNKHFDKRVIRLLFILVFISNILINVDHGTLPGCSKQLKSQRNVDNFGFGLLGSIVYGGLTLGAIVASGMFSKGDWYKPTLAVSLILNSVSLYAFTATPSFFLMVCFRGCIGFFQVFVQIY